MKAHLLTFTLGLAAFLPSTLAAEEDGSKKRNSRRNLPPQIVKEYDKDGDGKLSKEERKEARAAMKAKALAEFDKDGDGKLNAEERKAAKESRAKKRKERMLKKFDKDGDGKLSKEERETMRAESKNRRGPKGPKKQRQAKNKDKGKPGKK